MPIAVDRKILPSTRPMDQEWYEYSPFPTRKALIWPNGARVALSVVPAVACMDVAPPEENPGVNVPSLERQRSVTPRSSITVIASESIACSRRSTSPAFEQRRPSVHWSPSAIPGHRRAGPLARLGDYGTRPDWRNHHHRQDVRSPTSGRSLRAAATQSQARPARSPRGGSPPASASRLTRPGCSRKPASPTLPTGATTISRTGGFESQPAA